MEGLREFFQESFGVPLSEIVPLPDMELFEINNPLLYGSNSARQRPYLVQSEINDFLACDFKDYFLIGYWGHGINSYAFYYVRIDEWSRIYFRLAYGGIYTDERESARCVRKFLTNYFRFETDLKPKAKSLTAIDSMGDGNYTITQNNGKQISSHESLYWNADFSGRFSAVLQG